MRRTSLANDIEGITGFLEILDGGGRFQVIWMSRFAGRSGDAAARDGPGPPGDPRHPVPGPAASSRILDISRSRYSAAVTPADRMARVLSTIHGMPAAA